MKASVVVRSVVPRIVLAAVTVGLVSSSALGEFVGPTEAPIERLIKNVSAYTVEHPKDANGFYVLARLHTLAFVLNSKEVKAYEREKGLPSVDLPYGPAGQSQSVDHAPKENFSAEERLAHFKDSVSNYQKAIALAPDNALYHLGYAYAMESGSAIATEPPAGADNAKQPVEIKKAWLQSACDTYLKAYRKAIEADTKLTQLPIGGIESIVSHEAGQAFLRLVHDGVCAAKDEDKKEVQQGVEKIKQLKEGKVTPLIFSLERPQRLDELMSNTSVRFDLDGDMVAEDWPWVKPDTAILVWDPEHAGQITSGRQLFGSVTWWMFWTDAYQALDALDDNRDGVLSGDELRGLAVWRDANADGVSDPGEVIPIEETGIAEISVKATGITAGCPSNALGLRMRDGRSLPTYDWIVEPSARHKQSN